jgi:DNA-directed RNA polymerase specialized sigma24 family protein
VLALDEVLTQFAQKDPDKARLVKLRFFAGLSLPACAEALGWSEATTKRAWAFARAWLYRELTRE